MRCDLLCRCSVSTGHQESRGNYKLIQVSFSNSFLILWKNVCGRETNSYMLLSIFNETRWHNSAAEAIQAYLFWLISIIYCACICRHLTQSLSKAAQFSRPLIFHSASINAFFSPYFHSLDFIMSSCEEFPLDHLGKNITVRREPRAAISRRILLMKGVNLAINIHHCNI